MPTLPQIESFFMSLQDSITTAMQTLDGEGTFTEDSWQRPGGGGGRSRVMQQGRLFEKAGVGFSHVWGTLPEQMAKRQGLPRTAQFHATGVSLVMHPLNPHMPITHMNVRYFETDQGTHWFGGGIDLTPIYVQEEDARFFHQQLKTVCDRWNPAHYPAYKAWCDRYFVIRHRHEMRGIGGVFFDHLTAENKKAKEANWGFVQDLGNAFVPVYTEILRRHEDQSWTERERDFQLLRRSRYAEFNLVYDAGTKFGLETQGRIESILMSMPPLASWTYNFQPEPGSAEEKTIQLLQPRDWA